VYVWVSEWVGLWVVVFVCACALCVYSRCEFLGNKICDLGSKIIPKEQNVFSRKKMSSCGTKCILEK